MDAMAMVVITALAIFPPPFLPPSPFALGDPCSPFFFRGVPGGVCAALPEATCLNTQYSLLHDPFLKWMHGGECHESQLFPFEQVPFRCHLQTLAFSFPDGDLPRGLGGN